MDKIDSLDLRAISEENGFRYDVTKSWIKFVSKDEFDETIRARRNQNYFALYLSNPADLSTLRIIKLFTNRKKVSCQMFVTLRSELGDPPTENFSLLQVEGGKTKDVNADEILRVREKDDSYDDHVIDANRRRASANNLNPR